MKYDKLEIRQCLTIDNIFDLLIEWGGEPEYTDFGYRRLQARAL